MSKPTITELEIAIDTLIKVLNSLNPKERAEKAKRLYDVIGDLGAIYAKDKMYQKFLDGIMQRLKGLGIL